MWGIPRMLALAFVAGLAFGPAHAVTIYKWVDDDGVTHYAEHPPAGMDRDRITTIGGESSQWLDPEPDDDNGDEELVGAEPDDGPSTIDEFCEQIRRQLEVVMTVDDVRIETEDGQLRRLDDDARQQRRETLEAQIAQNC